MGCYSLSARWLTSTQVFEYLAISITVLEGCGTFVGGRHGWQRWVTEGWPLRVIAWPMSGSTSLLPGWCQVIMAAVHFAARQSPLPCIPYHDALMFWGAGSPRKPSLLEAFPSVMRSAMDAGSSFGILALFNCPGSHGEKTDQKCPHRRVNDF